MQEPPLPGLIDPELFGLNPSLSEQPVFGAEESVMPDAIEIADMILDFVAALAGGG